MRGKMAATVPPRSILLASSKPERLPQSIQTASNLTWPCRRHCNTAQRHMQQMLERMVASVPPPSEAFSHLFKASLHGCRKPYHLHNFLCNINAADKAAESESKRLLERMVATVPPILNIFTSLEDLELRLHGFCTLYAIGCEAPNMDHWPMIRGRL